MKHLSEEQIVLHCYGDAEEPAEINRHLSECTECQRRFAEIQSLLRQIEPVEVPEPPAVFEEKTWLRLRERLPQKHGKFPEWMFGTAAVQRWAVGAVAVLVIAAAFLAGRFWPNGTHGNTAMNNPTTNSPVDPQRVVLVAVGDHLERSQMLLVEVMNADPGTLADEQKEARDLLDTNYLYTASAQRAGDPSVARLLDELGRTLVEIANSPSQMSDADLRQIRGRIQSEGLLFKVRVVGSDVNSRLRQEQGSGANLQRL